MSIQTDVEMLSIRAMETYAKRHHLSGEAATELFHKCQVFEKIMIQHEYLHQVDFEEAMEYVDKIIGEESKELIVYHGTTYDFKSIELVKSRNRRDFGRGFYTTILKSQAIEWGYRLSLREKAQCYYLYQYIFEENEMLKIKRFDSLNKEWLEFIKRNRAKGGTQHTYDIVIGPVADDNTMETVQLYTSGILTAEEAVKRLRYSKVNNQVSFHTEKALTCLRFIGREKHE